MIKRVAKNKVQLLHSEKLGKLAWLVHAFSTRHGGVSRAYGGNGLNLGFTEHDSRAAVERNREIFLKELGVANGRRSWPLVSLRQIHSDLIHRVDRVQSDRMPEQPLAGDGILTDTPGLLVAVQTADCLPISGRSETASYRLFHAGWRGTVKRIVEKGVGEMRKHSRAIPGSRYGAIGRACRMLPRLAKKCAPNLSPVYVRYSLFAGEGIGSVRGSYPLLFLTARPLTQRCL